MRSAYRIMYHVCLVIIIIRNRDHTRHMELQEKRAIPPDSDFVASTLDAGDVLVLSSKVWATSTFDCRLSKLNAGLYGLILEWTVKEDRKTLVFAFTSMSGFRLASNARLGAALFQQVQHM